MEWAFCGLSQTFFEPPNMTAADTEKLRQTSDGALKEPSSRYY